ncbi:fungal-specific transcription factor domain-containing protein [Mariannaea sp. PMI_226]|nr:fungal-specific transcription factor domain-containing protein [Mariannaea sp. PMI_226]
MDNQQQNLQKHRQRREAERERKRALRACDGCRRQKEKCDGGVPCRRCTRLHRQCEFLGPTARDGDANGDGSNRNRSSASNAELLQRMAYMEKIITHYAGNISFDSETLKSLAESVDKNVDMTGALRQNAAVASPPGSDYLGVDDENFTVQPLDNNTTHYSGEFSHWNFSMRIKQWIEQCVPEGNRHDGAPTSLSFKEYYRAEELQSSNTLTSLASLPPRYVAEFLVQAFYTHAETNYFYVERGWFAEQLDLVYQNPGALSRREVGTVCIIWIVFAIGTQYAYLDSRPERGHAKGGMDDSPFSEDTIGIMFYQQACKLVPDVITVASLESVQAILLIGIYTLPLDASGLSYIYLNLAVKLAIQNGMHRRYPAEGIDPFIRETRNRVWWTAYTTEKRVGIYHGRPTSISSKDVDAETPVDRPDIMPSNPTNVAHMLATLRLNQALGNIANEISVLRTAQKHEITEGLNRVIEMKEELRQWWDSLPETAFRRETKLPNPIVSRADMHLKLEYCLLRMYAGRPFIFPREAVKGNASTSSSPADSNNQRPTTPHKLNPRSILVADCVEAALTVIDTCHLLQSTIGLARASYTEFSSCRAALLVIITQCLQKKTDRLRDALRTGMAMIKEMSAGGESAKSEASLIEVFERAISRLDATVEPSGRESDYSRFKKWELLWKNDVPVQEMRQEASPEASMPMPPNPANFWRGTASTTRPSIPAMHTASPFIGMDTNFPSVPQVMDEFSTLFGYGFGPSPESMAGTGPGGMWMGP